MGEIFSDVGFMTGATVALTFLGFAVGIAYGENVLLWCLIRDAGKRSVVKRRLCESGWRRLGRCGIGNEESDIG